MPSLLSRLVLKMVQQQQQTSPSMLFEEGGEGSILSSTILQQLSTGTKWPLISLFSLLFIVGILSSIGSICIYRWWLLLDSTTAATATITETAEAATNNAKKNVKHKHQDNDIKNNKCSIVEEEKKSQHVEDKTQEQQRLMEEVQIIKGDYEEKIRKIRSNHMKEIQCLQKDQERHKQKIHDLLQHQLDIEQLHLIEIDTLKLKHAQKEVKEEKPIQKQQQQPQQQVESTCSTSTTSCANTTSTSSSTDRISNDDCASTKNLINEIFFQSHHLNDKSPSSSIHFDDNVKATSRKSPSISIARSEGFNVNSKEEKLDYDTYISSCDSSTLDGEDIDDDEDEEEIENYCYEEEEEKDDNNNPAVEDSIQYEMEQLKKLFEKHRKELSSLSSPSTSFRTQRRHNRHDDNNTSANTNSSNSKSQYDIETERLIKEAEEYDNMILQKEKSKEIKQMKNEYSMKINKMKQKYHKKIQKLLQNQFEIEQLHLIEVNTLKNIKVSSAEEERRRRKANIEEDITIKTSLKNKVQWQKNNAMKVNSDRSSLKINDNEKPSTKQEQRQQKQQQRNPFQDDSIYQKNLIDYYVKREEELINKISALEKALF